MVIKKTNMTDRAAAAAANAPTIEDRVAARARRAQELAGANPLSEESPTTAAAPQTQDKLTPSGARLEIVPTEKIRPNPFNARRIYLAERIQKLAASLAAHGQEVPGLATFRNGEYILAGGHYRLKALPVAGIKNMVLLVRDNLTDQELYALSYRENAERDENTALDDALAWRALLEEGVYKTEAAIGEVTGQSQSNVHRTMSVLKLSSAVLELVKEKPAEFKFTVLNELVQYEKVAGLEKTLVMARRVLAGEVGRRDITEARMKLGKPGRKPKETSRQYKINSEGKATGVIKEWDSGRVSLEVTIADPKDREIIVNELRARFGVAD